MGSSAPKDWAEDKRKRLRSYVDGDVGEWSAKARDVCLPGVPLAALLGFAANGRPKTNTTGWLRGDAAERDEALRTGRKPLGGDPREGYGHVGSDDLHELAEYGVEGGHCPTPVATDPECAWVVGAKSDAVRKILGRAGAIGAGWRDDTAASSAIGVWNIRRHMNAVRKKLAELDPRLSWESDEKPVTPWVLAAASMSWSAGSGGFVKHVRPYAAALAPMPENHRIAEFLRRAAEVDGGKSRHGDDEWTGLRFSQKWAGAVLCAPWIAAEPWGVEWLRDDGFADDAERERVYARLVELS